MSSITIVQPRLMLEDPHNCTDMDDALTVLDAVYDALVRRTEEGYAPALATSWEVAEEGRVWTFALRRGVRFHDGTPFDAAAVVATLTRMARPDMGVTLGAPGVYAQYLAGAAFDAPDPATVVIALAEPLSDLLDLLVYGYVIAPSALGDPVANPVGTGPYVIEAVGSETISARSNPDHFAGPPRFERIVWQWEPDPDGRLAALKNGHAEVANRLPRGAGAQGVTMVDYLSPTTIIYLLNARSGPMTDKRVRRALNLALDRDALVRDVLGDSGVPLHGPFSPAHAGYLAPARTTPDPEAAYALLVDAGYSAGLFLDMDCPTSLPDESEALTDAVAAQLKPIGVRFNIRRHADREAYAHRVRLKGIGDLCVFDSSPLSTFRVLAEKIDSRVEGSWWQGYANRTVEDLIDQARRTPDNAARTALFEDAHRRLADDPPWLSCYCHTRRIGLAGNHPDWRMRRDGVIDVRALPPKL